MASRRGGARSRNKGSGFELWIAKQVSDRLDIKYGIEIRRTPNSGALITRADLWVSPKKRKYFSAFVEAKKQECFSLEGIENDKWPPLRWFKEAQSKLPQDPDYAEDSPVILVFCRNRVAPLVMLTMRDYKKLFEGLDLPKPPYQITLRDEQLLIIVPWDWFLDTVVQKVKLKGFM